MKNLFGFIDGVRKTSALLALAAATAPGVFIQDAGSDGLLVVEAEHFSTNTPGQNHGWTNIVNAMASGGNAMQAQPDSGTNYNMNYAGVSPRMDFNVYFRKTGTHYVWVRYVATGFLDDSVHFGLDGVTPSSDRMAGTNYNKWDWTNLRTNGTTATINVTNVGLHTLKVWMREDGFTLDKLLLTVNASYSKPAGTGPPESPTPGVFVQDTESNGLLVVEAEHFNTNTPHGNHVWINVANTLASGGNAMQAQPDLGTNFDSAYAAVSPRMDFNAYFTKTGTHYVWVRYFASGGMDDSMHFGLDSVPNSSSDRMGGTTYNMWDWTNIRTNPMRATINVTNAGPHTLNVWMREDGFTLDKLLLTVNTSYPKPSGSGPSESPFQTLPNPTTTNTSGRLIPSASDFAAASLYLGPGDIPEDTFSRPTTALFVAATGGSDSNPGTSNAPFATLDRATAIANANPSTPYTIYLRGGIHYFKRINPEIAIRRSNLYLTCYSNESVTIRPFYWPNNPTNYWDLRGLRALGPYTNITFDGMILEGWQIAVSVSGESATGPAMRQVTVKNIMARNFTSRGGNRAFFEVVSLTNVTYPDILPDPTTAHFQLQNVILSNVESHDTEVGIDIGDEHNGCIKGLRVSNYRIFNPPPPSPPPDQSEKDGIAVVNCYKVLIDTCTISNTLHDGIDLKSYDTLVADTLVQGTGKNGVKFWRNGELINSFVYRCAPNYDDGAVIAKFGSCRIVNSAVISKPIGYTATFGIDQNLADVGSLDIVNSIFLDLQHSIYVRNNDLTALNSLYFDVRDNLFTGGVGSIPNVGALNARTGSSNNIALDPMLTDPANGNFAPRAGSPCINAGTASGVLLPSFDYFGRSRTSGTRPDIGPIEYSVEPPMLTVLLAPGTGRLVIQWISAPGVLYDVLSANNLAGPWALVPAMSGHIGNGEIISVTNGIPDQLALFYKVRAQ